MMKLFIKIFLCGALCLTPSFLFAGYKPQGVSNSRFLRDDMLAVNAGVSGNAGLSGDSAKVYGDNKSPFVSKLVLSKEGEPLCVVDVGQSPHLLPPFWSASSSYQGPSEVDLLLPPCGNEERSIIHKLTQNSLLLEEGDLGVEVAGLLLSGPVLLCIGSAFLGAGMALWTHLDELPESDESSAGFLSSLFFFKGGIISGYSLDHGPRNLTNLIKKGGIVGVCGTVTYTLSALALQTQ